MLLRICEFRENQQNRGGGTLHRGVQEITFTRIPRNRITFQKWKIRLGKVGVRCVYTFSCLEIFGLLACYVSLESLNLMQSSFSITGMLFVISGLFNYYFKT